MATGSPRSSLIRGMDITIGLGPDNNGSSMTTTGGMNRRNMIRGQLTNGPLDGFRHALGCALTARTYGYCLTTYIAEFWNESSGSEDYQMDVYNNTVGARIGANNPDASDGEIFRLVWDAFLAGTIQLYKTDTPSSTSPPVTAPNSGQDLPAVSPH